MPQICIYLQLHQPWRLSDYSLFDLGSSHNYFSDSTEHNKKIFQKVAKKSYIPMLTLLKKLIDEEPRFTFCVSISGVFIEQAQEFEPRVIALLKQLAATKRVEFLAETYYHSLSALYSEAEFKIQVWRQTQLIQQLFNYVPVVFRNTELIYSNAVAESVAALGFTGMLTEAVDRYLGTRLKTQVYYSATPSELPLLLKHAQLSDDVAFRFSERSWQWYPLTVDRYLEWVEVYGEKEIVNLFMDFETFGEHQWEDSGIFDFFAHFVKTASTREWNTFVTPREVFAAEAVARKYAHKWSKKPGAIPIDRIYSVPDPISWADVDRDLTAWRGNDLQLDTLEKIYALETAMHQSKDLQLVQDWRRLQTSDHFYYMCTKWSADGDVHAYFSPYDSPYEAYRRFSVVLADLQMRL